MSANAGIATPYLNYLNEDMLASSATSKEFWGNDISSLSIGADGGDTFFVYSPKDLVQEAAGGGTSTMIANYGWYGAAILAANVDDLILTGDNVTGIGNELSNLMIAEGSGNVTLDGDGGDDVLVGGTGDDTFIVARGYGREVIYDFNPTSDQIRLENLGVTSYAALQADMTQVGSDVVITLDSTDSVIIRDATISELKSSDFEMSLNLAKMRPTFDQTFTSFTSSANGSAGWMTTFPYSGISARTLPSNNEAEYYSDSSVGVNPFSVSNGVLTITAAPATPGVGTPAGSGLTYTSGLITTYKSFSQLYGYFQITAKLPSGAGFWPAFWLLPANNSWPPEIDVLEDLGDDPTTIYETSHAATSGPTSSQQLVTTVPNATTTFNTYGVDWEANTITWYVNGVAVGSIPTPANMHIPMYLLINLAVGGVGSWPGATNGTASASMEISSVEVFAPTEVNAPLTSTSNYSDSSGQALRVSSTTGVLENDVDQNALTLSATILHGPAHGTLTLNATGSFVYTPSAGFAGADSFTYTASDTLSQSAATTVDITVAARAATTKASAYVVSAGQTLNAVKAAGVLIGDVDYNGLTLSAVLAQGDGPSHGTLSLNADGAFVYTPNSGFTGVDSFSYLANDSLSSSAPTLVSIRVTARTPTTAASTFSDTEGTPLSITAANGVLAHDVDLNGLALSAQLPINDGPLHGALSLNLNGSFIYTPNAGFVGVDSFSYLAEDSLSQSSLTKVTLDVLAPAH